MPPSSDAARTAKLLSGAPDLYTALRNAATGGFCPLPEVLAALDLSDPATAARLRSVDQGLLAAIQRAGSGQPAIAGAPALISFLSGSEFAPLFQPDVAASATCALLTKGQLPDMPVFSDRAFDAWFAAQGVPYGLGSYGEYRTVYQTDQFADAASPERRCVHLGIDVFAVAGTNVFAPLAGRVLYLTYNADPLDYGHTLILRHDAGPAPFFTLYGHLGDWHENGGWAAHVHFQVMTDMLAQTGGNFFGVGHASLWDVWSAICPDPNLILRIPADRFLVGPG